MSTSLNQALIGAGIVATPATKDRPRKSLNYGECRTEIRRLESELFKVSAERDVLVKILTHAAKS